MSHFLLAGVYQPMPISKWRMRGNWTPCRQHVCTSRLKQRSNRPVKKATSWRLTWIFSIKSIFGAAPMPGKYGCMGGPSFSLGALSLSPPQPFASLPPPLSSLPCPPSLILSPFYRNLTIFKQWCKLFQSRKTVHNDYCYSYCIQETSLNCNKQCTW